MCVAGWQIGGMGKPDRSRLIRQPQGGALYPPAPGNLNTSLAAVRIRCRELLADASEANIQTLLTLCRSDDPRVSVVAIKECNDRLWGRVSEYGMQHDAEVSDIDVTRLTPGERQELMGAIAVVRRLTAVARGHVTTIDVAG